MKIFNLFLFSFFLVPFSFSQAPEVEWEHLYCDGASFEFEFTADGGIIAITTGSNGSDCEKTEFGMGGDDYWVIKMDSLYNIQWQNVIGGSGADRPTCINKTADGGYIIAGTSNSPVSGDKTEPTIDLIYPYSDDIWILKLDASGNIMWQNTIGGNTTEYGIYIEQITGGGYILSANSNSIISGDKMEGTIGGTGQYDYWIIKLNNTGNIIWQNTIGGNSSDNVTSIHQTNDGGFIVAGTSNSEISGDKTEGTGGIEGNYDHWIIKLNSLGNIHWQNTIGGHYYEGAVDILQMPDGGYMVGGYAESYYDAGNFQLVKLKHNGAVDWINTFGCGGEELRTFSKTADGGFIFGGRSNSYTCDDKIDAGPPNTYGWDGYNMWVAKTDSLGNVEWDNALGSSGDDGGAFVRETSDGGYLVGGYAAYDDGAWDKSDPSSGAWLVKLKDSICIPDVELCNTMDDNCNGIVDDGVIESIVVSAEGLTSFCSGGEVELTVVTHTGTSLQWKKNGEDIPGATSANYTANAKGIYTCQTTSACAFAISEWIEVDVYKKPNANILPLGPTTFCEGESVTLSANAGGGQSYQWYKNGIVIAGATNINYVATTTGSYRCHVVKIFTGCSKLSNIIAVNVTCKEENEISMNDKFIIYPNPSSETVTIALIGTPLITDQLLLILTDVSGKTIAQNHLTSSATEIDISNYPSGIYFVKMIIDEKQLIEKFIKQ